MTLIPERRRWPEIFKRFRRPFRGHPYSKWLGFHADEDNGTEDVRLLTQPVGECRVHPPTAMRGAMALWRHIVADNYTDFKPQRLAAASYECESPTIILIPFTTQSPGTNDPAENAAVLAAIPAKLALYADENPIFGFGNLNGDNFMVGATAADRNAAWWALEGAAIKIISDAGYRWCATDDQGLSSLCQTLVARRAAWTAAGVEPDDCEFFCAHCYTNAGFVPSHMLMAEASFARVSVTTPIRVTEGAFGFLGVGFTDADKPWLLNEYQPGNAEGYPAHSLTWTRLLLQWFRTTERHFLLFDWTMMVRAGALSSWGLIFTEDQRIQPAFALPAAGSLWFNEENAPTRAFALTISNGGDSTDATEAAEWVQAGNLFTLPA